MNYFRKHMSMERLVDQRVEPALQSPSERSTPRPSMERSSTFDEADTRDPEFIIQDLASEPTNSRCQGRWGRGRRCSSGLAGLPLTVLKLLS